MNNTFVVVTSFIVMLLCVTNIHTIISALWEIFHRI